MLGPARRWTSQKVVINVLVSAVLLAACAEDGDGDDIFGGEEGGSDGGSSSSSTGASSSDGDDDDDGSESGDGGTGDGSSGGGDDDDDDEVSVGDKVDPPGSDEPSGTCYTGGPKGEVVQVELGSPERWYLIGAPDSDDPLPLVMAFHGDEGDPNNSTRWIWGNYWERNDLPFIVVMTKCPGCTSWYQDDHAANADYVWDVLVDVSSHHNVDINRIYAVGYSGGSVFLSQHGFEFQDVFAGIQFTCGGNAWGEYVEPTREECKVATRVVISRDDFLWDGANDLQEFVEEKGHPNEFVEAQCSGHCCDTRDDNEGAWEWFQQQVKCGQEQTGECGEVSDLP